MPSRFRRPPSICGRLDCPIRSLDENFYASRLPLTTLPPLDPLTLFNRIGYWTGRWNPLAMATVVLGAQFGDEGKGKLVDILCSKTEICARTAGGNNAGHTIVANGVTFDFHILPSGQFPAI